MTPTIDAKQKEAVCQKVGSKHNHSQTPIRGLVSITTIEQQTADIQDRRCISTNSCEKCKRQFDAQLALAMASSRRLILRTEDVYLQTAMKNANANLMPDWRWHWRATDGKY